MRLGQIENKAKLFQRQSVLQCQRLQIIVEKFSASVLFILDTFSGKCGTQSMASLLTQFLGSGKNRRRHCAVRSGIYQKTVDLQLIFFVILFGEDVFIKIVVIFENSQFHLDCFGKAHSLTGE